MASMALSLAAAAVVSVGLGCLGAAPARADVTYTYTGNDFTAVTPPYTTSDSITGSFDLTAPLADNLPETSISPIAYQFNDGVHTLTRTDPDGEMLLFEVSTNATGLITAWNIAIMDNVRLADIETANSSTLGQTDSGLNPVGAAGFNNNSPGSWTISTVPSVSEPSSVLLLSTGLLGLVFLYRRRRPLRLTQ